MTDDRLFGETDHEETIRRLEEIIKNQRVRIYCQDAQIQHHNAYLVEKGLAEDYVRWQKSND